MDSSYKENRLFKTLLQIAATTMYGQKITPHKSQGPFPLSFSQQRLWYLSELASNNAAYNVIRAFRVVGRIDISILKQSLTEIVLRQASLRTIVTTQDGNPAQIIVEDFSLPLRIIDLFDLPKTEQESRIQQHLIESSQKVFDLSKFPLFNLMLFRIGSDENVLLLVIHHIISDGWSISVFFQELTRLMKMFSDGEASQLSELPVQYTDFAIWQRDRIKEKALQQQISYWKEKLNGAPSILELPTDRPRPMAQTFRGAKHYFLFSNSLYNSIKKISKQEGVTLFMTLLAAFNVLLYRYTGQHDIVIGSPIAGRTQIDIENLIGFFVNTLAIRTNLSDNPSFRELLERVRNNTLEAYRNQDLPLDKLVEELKIQRNPAYSPLFQVLFTFQNHLPVTQKIGDARLLPIDVDNQTAKFDFTLTMIEREAELHGTFEYNTDLFDKETIVRINSHFQNLLENIIAHPSCRISDLHLLSEAERYQLLAEWNSTKTEYPGKFCIHQLFEEQVDRTPKSIAVVFENKQITYLELNQRANQLAHYLKKMGVGKEIVVGICVERSLEMMVGLMGILKAGGAYLPLDPAHPNKRLTYMLEDSHALILLTQKKLKEKFLDLQIPIHYLDAEWNEIAKEKQDNPYCDAVSDNLAYIMYTSGSTGKPKGVMISHRNVNGFLHSYREVTLDGPVRIGTSVATFSFDTSVEEFFSPLCFGGTLHIIRQEKSTNIEYFARYLVEKQITTTYILPYFLSGIADHLKEMRHKLNLKCVITGLEPKKQSALQSFRNLSDQIRILNAYGPTEVTYGATALNFHFAIDPDSDAPIGVPFPNYQVYIVDSHLQPVPIGVAGELVIGGIGLARGYFNLPALTAKKFIPNPFSNELGERLYRTGDMVRYLPDGNIDFLGRADHQTKIRGFRIELGEIETTLKQQPYVEDTVVLVREDNPGNKRIAAYVVFKNKKKENIGGVRNSLKEKLPHYMIPSDFVIIDSLPRMPNGKIDRLSLPIPDQTGREIGENFVAPGTPVEKALASLWGKVLTLDRIGIHDNFFDIGGHSLLATQVIARLRDVYKVELALRSFIEKSTIAEQALMVEQLILEDIQRLSEEEAAELLKQDLLT